MGNSVTVHSRNFSLDALVFCSDRHAQLEKCSRRRYPGQEPSPCNHIDPAFPEPYEAVVWHRCKYSLISLTFSPLLLPYIFSPSCYHARVHTRPGASRSRCDRGRVVKRIPGRRGLMVTLHNNTENSVWIENARKDGKQLDSTESTTSGNCWLAFVVILSGGFTLQEPLEQSRFSEWERNGAEKSSCVLTF